MSQHGSRAPRKPVPIETDAVASKVVDSAFRVHSALGPGLLESVYEACLCLEMERRGLRFRRQVSLPVVYDGLTLDAAFRVDILVEDCLILELKAVEEILPVHLAQVLTYLKLAGIRLGLLINFCSPTLKSGIKRIVL
jgi:GxxExxY protein